MHEFPDILQDGDIRLRPLSEDDLPTVAHQINDNRVARWLAVVSQPFDAAELLEHGEQPGEFVRVVEKAGTLVGGLCIGASLWYWLSPDWWRKGIMRQALRLAITARFHRSAPPLIATCHVDNAASCALLNSLGFAASPARRRMFFHGTQSSEPCRDYLLAPEQWHLLHPPRIPAGTGTLRPAEQCDAAALAFMLHRQGDGPWPEAAALPEFIEWHRFRGGDTGLFVVVDANRRSVGMALLRNGTLELRFLSDEDDRTHRVNVSAGLAQRFAASEPSKETPFAST